MLHQNKQELERFAETGHVVGVVDAESSVQTLLDAVSYSEIDIAKVQVIGPQDAGEALQTRGAVRSGLSDLEAIAGSGPEAAGYAEKVSHGAFVVALPADNGYARSQAKARLTGHGADAIQAFDPHGIPIP